MLSVSSVRIYTGLKTKLNIFRMVVVNYANLL
jgi:hypothetical protein